MEPLDRTETRLLGALIEKRWSTPDQYPLTENALLAACNQKSNRDPVMSLLEMELRGALLALREKGLVLVREREGGRVTRYAEQLSEKLSVGRLDAAILAELMLRGPQTENELARRATRMCPVEGPGQVGEVLRELARDQLVRLLPRAAGQRHARWTHLLGTPAEPETAHTVPDSESPIFPEEPPSPPTPRPPSLREEVDALKAEVAELRERLDQLERR